MITIKKGCLNEVMAEDAGGAGVIELKVDIEIKISELLQKDFWIQICQMYFTALRKKSKQKQLLLSHAHLCPNLCPINVSPLALFFSWFLAVVHLLFFFSWKRKGWPDFLEQIADLLCCVKGSRGWRGEGWMIGEKDAAFRNRWIDGGELTVWKLMGTRASAEGIVKTGRVECSWILG